jgi:acyl-CoA synthetase (AMP-forming)/AMP-acid ligase II
MVALLGKLHDTGLLTVAGVVCLLEALATTGTNLMAMLRVAARLHPRRTALDDGRTRLTYDELWRQAEALAGRLAAERGVRAGHRVALVCGNHAAAVKALSAASRLGAHVYLVNPESSPDQIRALEEALHFDLYVHDGRAAALDAPALRDWLKPRVARYQMPAVIAFRDELPHTPLGKTDKKALRA